ncbi:ada2a-containing complex component 3 isoform d [Anaeramoeba flamelloides]|uniref:Ada2a-containing complex component 3 isoform d n=1 Tax=Anaeramoeba flamelloides TaxID=1746091 RepID=A0AAV8A4D8_9EUKA|nr:ada2a-containing complex component 3 isoform d [Anaeramoeba flamelloides]
MENQIDPFGTVVNGKSGYTFKQGGNVKSWKKRWVVIRGKQILYYKHVDDETPMGIIHLSKHCHVEATDQKKYTCCFKLDVPNRRTFIFSAASEIDKTEWIKEIEKWCNVGNYTGSSNPKTYFYGVGDQKLSKRLLDAITNGTMKKITALLKKGVFLNDIAVPTKGNFRNPITPLFLACYLGNKEIAEKLLIAGASVHRQNDEGKQPLWAAAWSNNSEIGQLLLDHGANINHLDSDKNTALFIASQKGNYKMVKFLCEKNIDIRILGKGGITPLHVCAKFGKNLVAEYLLERGVDPLIVSNEYQEKTAEKIARANNHIGLADMIKNASIKKK